MRVLALLVSAMLVMGAAASPTDALLPEDVPLRETGVVTMVNDGDTFRMIPDGQSDFVSVRLIGVNAPEVAGFQNKLHPHDYCGGPQAYRELQRLLPAGTRVELRSMDPESSNRGRIRRAVFAFNPQTQAYDINIAAELARSGWVTWFETEDEPEYAALYRQLVDQAQAAQIGIWNPGVCGPIEQDGARLTLSIHWDAPGNDAMNRNGEYVIVRNAGTSAVDISGWLLRDSALDYWFTMPNGSVLAPGDYRVVHVGSGTPGSPGPRDLYMNAPIPLFPNTRPDLFIGDSAYLLDRNTAYRAWTQYPCLDDCQSDPGKGILRIVDVKRTPSGSTANARANSQVVTIKNTGRLPILLDEYYLRRQLSTFSFVPGTVLKPGATLRVHVGKGRPTATDQYWGLSAPLFSVRGDMVDLRSVRDVLVSRKAWGD